MKVSQAYSMVCVVFANNFANALNADKLKNLSPNWLLKSQNSENQKGLALLQKALDSDAQDLSADLNSFKLACSLKFFKQISDEEVEHFYRSINFNRPFTNLRPSHISNMFALLSAIFKNDTNDKSHAVLGLYLVEYFIPSMLLFAKFLRYNAKTYYYQALAEFMIDFAKILKANLGLKVEIE